MAQVKHGNTSINMAYSLPNQGWIVWREDSGYQALARVHNEQWEAREDYENRVAFFLSLTLGGIEQ